MFSFVVPYMGTPVLIHQQKFIFISWMDAESNGFIEIDGERVEEIYAVRSLENND